MKIIVARFYPRTRASGKAVIVGWVVCMERESVLKVAQLPHDQVAPFDPTSVKARLRYLVALAGPPVPSALLAIRSDYWEFRDVTAKTKGPDALQPGGLADGPAG